MSYERIPQSFEPTDVLGAACRADSLYVPALKLVIVNQLGSVALVTGKNGVSLRLPEGSLHRPNPKFSETVQDKVATTARNRTNATLGPNARVVSELVTLIPYVDIAPLPLDKPEKENWPKAKGKIFMPAVAPTIVYGPDPNPRHEVTWAQPDQALEMLHDNYTRHDAELTRSAFEALQVSMPVIPVIAPTLPRN